MEQLFNEQRIISNIIEEKKLQRAQSNLEDDSDHEHSICSPSHQKQQQLQQEKLKPSPQVPSSQWSQSIDSNAIVENDPEALLKIKPQRLNLHSYDMWALGITIVIGGQYFAWNEGLSAGFGSFVIATFFIATAYYCLILCIAELSSALPFAGGSYGIARVTIGIYPGYLVGCCDSIESVVYVAVAALTIGKIVTSITLLDEVFEPLWWFLFYATAVGLQCWGGRLFWRINMIMAVISFLMVLVFIFGAAKYANLSAYAPLETRSGYNQYFQGGFLEFMRILPLPSWFFVGVESINLACKDIDAPKRNVPIGYITCVTTLFLTCMGVLFVCCSLPPGSFELQSALTPLNYGFKRMFGISDRFATILSLPATYATAYGFMFCYGRQMRSMGRSGILPRLMGKSLAGRGTPYVSLLVGAIVGYTVCIIVYIYPPIGLQIFNVSMLGAFCAYFSQFFSFIMFRRRYSNIKREFKSPLGIPGAIYGLLIFFLAMCGIIGFQENQYAIITFITYIFLVSIYYLFVVKNRQYFSDEEKEVLFIAHLTKNNMLRAEKRKKKIHPESQLVKQASLKWSELSSKFSIDSSKSLNSAGQMTKDNSSKKGMFMKPPMMRQQSRPFEPMLEQQKEEDVSVSIPHQPIDPPREQKRKQSLANSDDISSQQDSLGSSQRGSQRRSYRNMSLDELNNECDATAKYFRISDGKNPRDSLNKTVVVDGEGNERPVSNKEITKIRRVSTSHQPSSAAGTAAAVAQTILSKPLLGRAATYASQDTDERRGFNNSMKNEVHEQSMHSTSVTATSITTTSRNLSTSHKVDEPFNESNYDKEGIVTTSSSSAAVTPVATNTALSHNVNASDSVSDRKPSGQNTIQAFIALEKGTTEYSRRLSQQSYKHQVNMQHMQKVLS